MSSPGPTQDFWQSRFVDRATPWDRGAVNPQLVNWVRGGVLRPVAGTEGRASGSDDPRVTRILVTGCGSGHEVAMLAEWGFDVTAVDYAPAALEQTRNRLRRLLQGGAERMVRAELVEHDLLVPTSESHARRAFDAAVETAGLPVRLTEFSSSQVAQAVAAAGRGIAVVSDDPRYDLVRLLVTTGSGDVLRIGLHAAWSPHHHGAAHLAVLVQRLRRFVRDRYDQPR